MVKFEREKMIKVFKIFQTVEYKEDTVIYTSYQGNRTTIDEELPGIISSIFENMVLLMTCQQPFLEQLSNDPSVYQYSTIPEWLNSMANCVLSNEPNICNAAIEGIIYIISSQRRSKVYTKLRELLLKESQKGDDERWERKLEGRPRLR